MKNQKTILIILDGWGIGKNNKFNPIQAASTPILDKLFSTYPHSYLRASGAAVGLPSGVMGNSEVGHLNLGSGRVVAQDLVKINKACADKSIYKNKALLEAVRLAKVNNRALHIIGLISDGGVHSHYRHLLTICNLAKQHGLKKVFIHAITDGRDTDPKSAIKFVKLIEQYTNKSTGKIATVIGRYYAMDRDNHWERIKKAYQLIVNGRGKIVTDFKSAIKDEYENGITDEFMSPMLKVDQQGKPIGVIKKDDVVICFNFRTERLRELTIALSQKNIISHGLKKIPLHYFTLTKYDDFKNIKVIFEKEILQKTLGEIIAAQGLKQLRIAETEKYAHVTYFFSGGRQKLFPHEKRILIKSPRVATYDKKPEMSANLITRSVVREITNTTPDFICLNFANGDMVGHTGNFSAIVQAIQTIDSCLATIVTNAQKHNYEILITADHGNAEAAVNADGTINTAHSLNPVPCLLISPQFKRIKNGILADIAPTILKLMSLPIPKEMTGKNLL